LSGNNKIKSSFILSSLIANALVLAFFFTAFDISFGFFRFAPQPFAPNEIILLVVQGLFAYFVIGITVLIVSFFVLNRFGLKSGKDKNCTIFPLILSAISLWIVTSLNWLYYYFYFVKITPRFFQILTLLFALAVVLVLFAVFIFKKINGASGRWVEKYPLICLSLLIPLIAHISMMIIFSTAGYLKYESLTFGSLMLIAVSVAWSLIALFAGILSFKGKLGFSTPSIFKSLSVTVIFIVIPLFGVPAFFSSDEAAENGGYNYVLLTFDTLRADALGAYGGKFSTPVFNSFAAKNIVFEKSYSSAPWTIPSMVSLFSSQSPSKLSVGNSLDYYRISPEAETFSEALDKKRYKSAAFIGNYLLRKSSGISQGFDSVVTLNHHTPVMNRFSFILPLLGTMAAYTFPEEKYKYLMDSSQILKEGALRFIKENKGNNFFLWVHFVDPHDPYNPPGEFRGDIKGEKPWPLFAPMDESLGFPQLFQIRDGKIYLKNNEKKYIRQLYDGEVLYMDKIFEDILNALRDEGIYDKTVICVTSDHGEEFWEHNDYYHGQSLYDELVRVPLIFSIPGVGSPKKIQSLVSAIDVMPTFFDIAGIEKPALYEGESLMPYIEGEEESKDKRVFCEGTYYFEKRKAIIENNYKLIMGMESGKVELYDLEQNPEETEDVSFVKPEMMEKMKKELSDWIEKNNQAPKDSKESANDEKIREEQLNQMKALGYVN